MAKLNPKNERIKRDYLRWLKEAKGKSDASLDATRKALARFEVSTGAKDFATFRREQAISFKERLAETDAHRTGEPLSAATQTATLTALRDFFVWLAWQPGFKSKIGRADVDYLTPSRRDAARAKAPKHRDFPSLEQVRAAIAAVPTDTVLNRRTRALLAFLILTGIRDGALVSLTLGDVDLTKSPPVVRQDPNRIDTKFAKAIVTFFFPVGDDFAAIVSEWVDELRRVHLFGPTDPLFPRTRVAVAGDGMFAAEGIDRASWSNASPVREACGKAFTAAGLPTFPPHAFRHTLGHLQHTMCRTIEEAKAWSQNLGHENMGTTFTSYGHIDTHRQGELIGRIGTGGGPRVEDAMARDLAELAVRYWGGATPARRATPD